MEKELIKISKLKYSPGVTLDKLKELFKTEDIDLIFVKIITGYHLTIEEIKNIWNHIQVHGTYQSIIKTYLLKRTVKNFGVFYTSLFQIFDKELNPEEMKFLKKEISNLSEKTKIPVDDAEHFLTVSIGELTEAPTPPWVNVQDGENLSLLTTVSAGGEVSDKRYQSLLDEATDIFYSFTPSTPDKGNGEGTFVKEKIDLDIRDTIQTYLSSISSLEIDPRDEILPNRVFGPQNRFEDKNCPYNLNEIGPCRMLNCYCREGDDLNWFSGTCDICKKTILNKSHALRYPFKNGGWVGVFCSWDCLNQSDFFAGTEDVDQYLRLENLRNTLDMYGIMDRSKT